MTNLMEKLERGIPIVQAPMAGTSTPELAAAVTEAGGLGSIAIGATNADGARAMLEATRRLTNGPFNVNAFCHAPAARDAEREQGWLDALRPAFAKFGAAPPAALGEIYTSFRANDDALELLLEFRPAVASFHFGLPSARAIGRLKAAGVLTFASATSLSEAKLAVDAGVDAIVAQGWEAGGHRGLFDPDGPDDRLGTFALTRLLTAQTPLPVIAAGGMMDGAGIAAALALGAVAAQLGTAFVACPESCADEHHRAALFGPGAAHTEMTRVISGRPARCLPNAFTSLARSLLADTPMPDYPLVYDAGKALIAAAKSAGDGRWGAQWAGQGAPLARKAPAAELMRILAGELAAV